MGKFATQMHDALPPGEAAKMQMPPEPYTDSAVVETLPDDDAPTSEPEPESTTWHDAGTGQCDDGSECPTGHDQSLGGHCYDCGKCKPSESQPGRMTCDENGRLIVDHRTDGCRKWVAAPAPTTPTGRKPRADRGTKRAKACLNCGRERNKDGTCPAAKTCQVGEIGQPPSQWIPRPRKPRAVKAAPEPPPVPIPPAADELAPIAKALAAYRTAQTDADGLLTRIHHLRRELDVLTDEHGKLCAVAETARTAYLAALDAARANAEAGT